MAMNLQIFTMLPTVYCEDDDDDAIFKNLFS